MSTDAPWLSDAEQQVWRLFLRLQNDLPVALARQLAEAGKLTLPDYEVLVVLSEIEGEALRVSELAERLGWERSRLSHQLRRMGERGLVDREDCPTDKRGSFARLTPAGQQAIEQAAPGHAALVRQLLFEAVDEAEIDSVQRFFTRAAARLAEQ